jgi:hypothetical protein
MFTVGMIDVFGAGSVGEFPVDACGGSLAWSLQPASAVARQAARRSLKQGATQIQPALADARMTLSVVDC